MLVQSKSISLKMPDIDFMESDNETDFGLLLCRIFFEHNVLFIRLKLLETL